MWNEAVVAGIWVGDREVKRTEYQDLFASILSDTTSNWVSLVAPTGFQATTAILSAFLASGSPDRPNTMIEIGLPALLRRLDRWPR